MKHYTRLLAAGIVFPLAVALSGCAGDSSKSGETERLDAAVAAATTALEMELPDLDAQVVPVGVRNDVPVVQLHAGEDAPPPYTGAYGYGGWLGERGFAVYSAPAAGVSGDTYMLADPADMSEGAPAEASGFSGTWNGVMLGVDTTVTGDGGVQGDARMNLHSGMGGATVDVEFSDVAGINNDMTYDGHSWAGISLDGSSFDGMSSGGGTIDGQFYGAHHENVMGDFAYDSLKGAWGAVRMPESPDDDGMGDGEMMDDDMMDDDMMDDDDDSMMDDDNMMDDDDDSMMDDDNMMDDDT